MAIDRHGVAWVLFSSGVLVNVDLHDFRCTEVLVRGLPPNVALFGMAFAKDDTQTGESLYVLNSDLMRIDPITHDATVRGRTKMPGWGELTGTGDGQLYGYSPYNGVILHFDKSNGASLKDYRTSALDANDWAFAQWGGDFWIFKRVDPAKGASVYRYSPKTDETTLVLENGPVRVIGAGSSTCAPFQPVE
jgi:hypothetical protein